MKNNFVERKCIRCNSANVEYLAVASRIALNYPEKRTGGTVIQRQVCPTEALICNECGHVELFVVLEK